MIHLQGITDLPRLPRGCAVSIGNYDGVHRGHAAIIAKMRALAPGSPIAVITFEPHPLTVLRPQLAPPRLTPPGKKLQLLESLGVTHVLEIPPTRDVLGLEARQFWDMILSAVAPSHVVEGPNFNFGKARGGNVRRMMEWSAGTSTRVHLIEPQEVALLNLSLVEVSSTIIRWLLAHGRVRDAAVCLGRPYSLIGPVIRGFQRGRTIGVPTANLAVQGQLVPDEGVYAGRCVIDGTVYPAAVSIGSLPTFDDDAFQVEAHLLDFSGDIYGRTIEVELLDWLREQRKYSSIESLTLQIQRDIARLRGAAA